MYMLVFRAELEFGLSIYFFLEISWLFPALKKPTDAFLGPDLCLDPRVTVEYRGSQDNMLC
jgi:hypothetical protein